MTCRSGVAQLKLVEQAQRLVRRICAACSADDTANVPPRALLDVGFPPDAVGAFPVMKGQG
jgi:type II secretory ATPase GspE/PulE/Tfp pilus assembly ATPase PilB-like protein